MQRGSDVNIRAAQLIAQQQPPSPRDITLVGMMPYNCLMLHDDYNSGVLGIYSDGAEVDC
jgi:hypothetical protein